ncbi:MAG: hypothetical protein IPO15_26995 [Anaerolineae bacterium]|uniref:hypothetical protein n=1 Tax=Candidatus Amarolinea dominans TaxID=3140696 RepID=UPI00313621B8|nr:hypothetical protein [Anaerolineae bacterium]
MPEMGKIFTGSSACEPFGLIAPALSTMLGVGEGGCALVDENRMIGQVIQTTFTIPDFTANFQDWHNQPYHIWGHIAQTTTPGNTISFELNFALSQWGNLIMRKCKAGSTGMTDGGAIWQDWFFLRLGY